MTETFGIRELKPYQTDAVVQFLQKIDVLEIFWLDMESYLFIKLYRLSSTQFLKLLTRLMLWLRDL